MPSLLDTLDRFNSTSSSIRSLTLSQPSRADPGPFTAAILDLTLHDLLREADEAEYGLFSFVKESSDTPHDGLAAHGKVGRREFRGASPLKPKRVASTNREEEPEVYVEAALKYLDRFHAVKPMPQARTHLESLIDRLNNVRDNLDRLHTSLEEASQTGRASPKSQIAEEERRIGELKSRILQLRKLKEALVTKIPATPKQPSRNLRTGSRPTPQIPDKSYSLLDEELDMSGMDALLSPPPPIPSSSRVPTKPDADATSDADKDDPSICETNTDEESDDACGSGEPTVVISQLRPDPAPIATPPSPPPSRPHSQTSVMEPQTPVQGNKATTGTTAPPSTKAKVRRVRITADVERVCTKIWRTIPDLLVPGNSFSSPGKRHPNAKDTIAVLQTITAQPIPDPSTDNPSSPSTRSTLSSLLGIETFGPAVGTPHQIMTAHVLLSLFNAPNHEMPLTALKNFLASKTAVPSPGPDAGREAKQNAAALSASAAQVGTRALYGCVAKKIVKIDRGGVEQIVKFDRV